MLQKLSRHEAFINFLQEIGELGFTVSSSPSANTVPYGVIGGRTNARWWLVPLENRLVATSGLALFQPVLPSARIIKRAASVINSMGLSPLWAREKIYISCPPLFLDLFNIKNYSYAFFTGTDSPHRKTAIQIMDQKGKLHGFAKVTRSDKIKKLIIHEGDFLHQIKALRLSTAYIPNILLSKEINGARVLVTDTLKTNLSKSPMALGMHHINFLTEMAKKSKGVKSLHQSDFLHKINFLSEQFATLLPRAWQKRLDKAIQSINQEASDLCIETTSCHGDFTPWNCFIVDNKLFVFDWEYSEENCSPGYDLCHFLLSLPQSISKSNKDTINTIKELLKKHCFAQNSKEANLLILCYLYHHTLQYVFRERKDNQDQIKYWDDMQKMGILMDQTNDIIS